MVIFSPLKGDRDGGIKGNGGEEKKNFLGFIMPGTSTIRRLKR